MCVYGGDGGAGAWLCTPAAHGVGGRSELGRKKPVRPLAAHPPGLHLAELRVCQRSITSNQLLQLFSQLGMLQQGTISC